MNTISAAVERIIRSSPFIEEGLSKNLINITSLARLIQSDVCTLTKKKVKTGAIVMAIHRRPPPAHAGFENSIHEFLSQLGDVIVRSDLIDFSFLNSPDLLQKQVILLQRLKPAHSFFYSSCKGMTETTIVISQSLTPLIEEIFKEETIILTRSHLAAVSVTLPERNLDLPGIYYFLLREVAWRNINVVEVLSTSHEITLVVSKEDVDKVFSIFMHIKNTSQPHQFINKR